MSLKKRGQELAEHILQVLVLAKPYPLSTLEVSLKAGVSERATRLHLIQLQREHRILGKRVIQSRGRPAFRWWFLK